MPRTPVYAVLYTEMKIRTEEDAVTALVRLHKLGPQVRSVLCDVVLSPV